MARLFVNVSPLRESRDFRLLFTGQLTSMVGSQLTIVAVAYQVYLATHSSWWVGVVSLIQLGPLIVGALWGGAIGDRHDRRLVLAYAATALAVLSAALALNAQRPHSSLAAIIALAAIAGAFNGVANTQRSAAIARLVRSDQLVAAYALNQSVIQLSAVVGPAVAGVLIATVSLPACYWIDAGTFAVLALTSLMMSPLRPTQESTATSTWRSIGEGFAYVRRHPVAQCVYLIDLNAMIFGMPTSLFPALALTSYHGGPRTLGLLYAAPGAGALLGAVASGWVEHIRRRGRAVAYAVAAWGVAIALFGLSSSLILGVIFLALAGWADVISAVLRNTILQSSIADVYRGRLSGIQLAVVQGGPRLGNFEAGAVAAAVNTEFSVVSGGVACVVGVALLMGWRPPFWREDAATTTPSVA